MLPFVLSPYLRPVVDDGVVRFDNGVTGALESVSAVEADVIRALWEPLVAQMKLARLRSKHGPALGEAIEALRARHMVFDDVRQCDAFFDAVLDQNVPAVPFVDQIELTNLCPMRCAFCPRGVPGRMKRATGFMELSLFERVLGELDPAQARYRPLELHHLGESLLHPEVDRFVAAATRRGLPTEMSMNPSLLTPDIAARLVDAGLSRIVLSLDGMDDETLVSIRGPAAKYTKAERNIDALLAALAKRTAPPKVVLQMIELHKNEHQREAFLARWGTLGIPYVEAYVKPLDGPDPDLGRATTAPLVYLCSYPWRSVVVLWDGRVVPCCRDDDARYVLGDLQTQSLAEIWRGEAALALRDAHRRGAFGGEHLCEGCAWSRPEFARAMPSRHPDRATRNPLQW